MLEVRRVSHRYPGEDGFEIRELSLSLQPARCLAVLGPNEAGKTTLAKLVAGVLRPRAGIIAHAPVPGAASRPSRPWGPALWWALTAALCAYWVAAGHLTLAWTTAILAVLGAACALLFTRHVIAPGTAVITSEDWAPSAPRPGWTILQALARDSGDEGRRQAQAYLENAGFQMYDEHGRPWGSPREYLERGVRLGDLSGGQRHLIRALSALAARPRLLICDEPLCGLDLPRRARLLKLIKEQQRLHGTAVLFLTVDYAAARIMADDFAFMDGGALAAGPVEGAAVDSLECRALREYVREFELQEALSRGKHLRAEFAQLPTD